MPTIDEAHVAVVAFDACCATARLTAQVHGHRRAMWCESKLVLYGILAFGVGCVTTAAFAAALATASITPSALAPSTIADVVSGTCVNEIAHELVVI